MSTRLWLACVGCLACLACATTTDSRAIASAGALPAPAEGASLSLFPSDSAVLSDDAIARILDASVRLPERVKVALLHIDHRSAARFWGYGPFWTTLAPATHQTLTDAVATALRTSKRVDQASDLPSFLLPEKPAVGQLREAAARFQADAVFVYRTDCQAYTRQRFFRNNQVKAFCMAETVLLDVRSGLVPFTSRSLRDFTVEQQYSVEFAETLRDAETGAFTAALQEGATHLAAYLDASQDQALP